MVFASVVGDFVVKSSLVAAVVDSVASDVVSFGSLVVVVSAICGHGIGMSREKNNLNFKKACRSINS